MGPAASDGAALSEERPLRWLMALAAAGVALSAYLTVLHLAVADDPGRPLCAFGPFLSCDRVLSSPHATVGGVPLAVIGVAGFGVLLALAAWRFVDRGRGTAWLARAAFFGTALAFGYQATATAATAGEIGAACPACLVVLAVSGAAVAAAWRLRVAVANAPAVAASARRERRRVLLAIAAGGAGLLAALLGSAWLQVGSASARAPRPLAVGQAAPAFEARGLDGRLHRLQDYLGVRPVVLEFLWTFCPHCQAMAPTMRELADAYGERLAILSIAADPRDGERLVRDFAQEHRHPWPYLLAGPRLLVAYGVTGYPTIVVLDRDGRVRATIRGEASVEALKEAVETAFAPPRS